MPAITFDMCASLRTKDQTRSIGRTPSNCTAQARATARMVSPVESEMRCMWISLTTGTLWRGLGQFQPASGTEDFHPWPRRGHGERHGWGEDSPHAVHLAENCRTPDSFPAIPVFGSWRQRPDQAPYTQKPAAALR